MPRMMAADGEGGNDTSTHAKDTIDPSCCPSAGFPGASIEIETGRA